MSQSDFFQLFGLPFQPCVDEKLLKEVYLKLSSSLHPDKTSDASSVEPGHPDPALINEAHRILSHAPSRLKHFLTILDGSAPGNLKQVPQEIGDLFMEVGGLLQKLDSVIKEKPAEDASELSRVLFLKKSMVSRQQTEAMLDKIQSGIHSLQLKLDSINQLWSRESSNGDVSSELTDQLTQIYHEWTFLDRWQSQLRERLLELTV